MYCTSLFVSSTDAAIVDKRQCTCWLASALKADAGGMARHSSCTETMLYMQPCNNLWPRDRSSQICSSRIRLYPCQQSWRWQPIRRSDGAVRSTCWCHRHYGLVRSVHWLPVCRRIRFKIALITYKSLSTNQPSYLRNLLHPHRPSRSLRSTSQNRLCIPSCTTNFRRRAFSFFSATTVWNKLPAAIRESNTLDTFKRRLKTHLTSLPSCNLPSLPARRLLAPQIRFVVRLPCALQISVL